MIWSQLLTLTLAVLAFASSQAFQPIQILETKSRSTPFQSIDPSKTSTQLRSSSIEFQEVLVPMTLAMASVALSYQVDRDGDFVANMFKSFKTQESVPEPYMSVVEALEETPVAAAAIDEEKAPKSFRSRLVRLVKPSASLAKVLCLPWLGIVAPRFA
jgi:hypothetical protein